MRELRVALPAVLTLCREGRVRGSAENACSVDQAVYPALISAANQPPSALRMSSPWDFHHWCRTVMSVPTEKCRTPMSRKYFA